MNTRSALAVVVLLAGCASAETTREGQLASLRSTTHAVDAKPMKGQSPAQRDTDIAACEQQAVDGAKGSEKALAGTVLSGSVFAGGGYAGVGIYRRWEACMKDRGYGMTQR